VLGTEYALKYGVPKISYMDRENQKCSYGGIPLSFPHVHTVRQKLAKGKVESKAETPTAR
jgi:hypothetical protein